MSRTFLYARVSRADQNAGNQVAEIAASGFNVEVHRQIMESISGSVPASERPQFARLLDRLEPGDRIIVTKLDRLGRNAMDIRSTVDRLAEGGVHVHCLALGGTDLTSPAGRMTMAVIAAVAEFERDLIVERTQSALRRAKEEGKRLGRPPALSSSQRTEARKLRAEGHSLGDLSKRFGVSRAAIQRLKVEE